MVSTTAGGIIHYRTRGVVQCYIFPYHVPGSIPLKRFYNKKHGDYITVASAASIKSARSAGYQFQKVEGYIIP